MQNQKEQTFSSRVTMDIESFYEDITLKAVTDTVAKLLKYPFGFHGDTGIRDYLYARLHVHGGKRLDVDDSRPGYSTLLLQSEHYTTLKYKNKGKGGKRARFDIALTLPPKPKSVDSIRERYAEELVALFAFELGKNKNKKNVIDPAMFNYAVDSHPRTTDISKLFLDLVHYDDLRQGWAIEFYDSRKINGVSSAKIIDSTLDICKKINLKAGKKLVAVFVEFFPDGKHHVSSNDLGIQEFLIAKLAGRGINAQSEVSYSKKPMTSDQAKRSPGSPQQDELFVKGSNIIKYAGKFCHLSCKGYSFVIRHFQNGQFVEIDRGRNDREKYFELKNQIQVLEKAPQNLTDVSFWSTYFQSLIGGNQ